MSNPTDLRYTKEHEWARAEDDGTLTVGITAYAAEALGDVVYVELPAEGDVLTADERLGVVESVKTVSDLFAPCSGEVAAVNEALEDAPEKVNADPFGDGWMLRIRPSNPDVFAGLLDAAAYDAIIAAESH